MTRLSALLAAPLALCAACVPYEAASIPDSGRFEALGRRDLSAYEQRLASERQIGSADAWTQVGHAWLALASCEPIKRDALDAGAPPEARVVYETLVLEEVRRRKLLMLRGAGLAELSITGTMFAQLDDAGFFNRKPSTTPDDSKVLWPQAEEAWADELPAARAVPERCNALYKEVMLAGAAEAKQSEADGIRIWSPLPREIGEPPAAPGSIAWHQQEELRLIDAALTALASSPERDGQGAQALAWTLMYHRATTVARQALLAQVIAGKGAGVMGLATRQQAYLKAACGWMAPLGQRELAAPPAGPLDGVADAQRALATLYHGKCEEAAGRLSEAAASYDRARAIGLAEENVEVADYAALRVLTRLGKWEEAARFVERLPPPTSRLYTASVYRVGVALRRTGQQDRLLALSLQAFRDRAFRPDPFLRALYIQTLRQLVAYPFEARVVEVIEDLGPRDRIFERIEEYAAVSLDMGEPENARAAARWLLAKHWSARYAPRYYALLALADFLEDDAAGFERAAWEIVRREQRVEEAVGATRSPAFFAAADAELARLLRQMLPVMAEWGDTPDAMARRQRWLAVVVKLSQDFVRQTPETLARPSLVELYRLASAMLETEQARAYPERVGQLDSGPLVLGTVRVEDRDLAAFEPDEIGLEADAMWSLTLLPTDGAPFGGWPMFWERPRDAEEVAR